MKILMVCLGNICRSPLAEEILRSKALKAGLNWQVDSAGTLPYHVGEMPHTMSRQVALENGLDISHQRARLFKPTDLDEFDHVYAMAVDVFSDILDSYSGEIPAQKLSLMMDVLYPGKQMDVPDPYTGTLQDFRNTYRLLEEACDAVVKQALEQHTLQTNKP